MLPFWLLFWRNGWSLLLYQFLYVPFLDQDSWFKRNDLKQINWFSSLLIFSLDSKILCFLVWNSHCECLFRWDFFQNSIVSTNRVIVSSRFHFTLKWNRRWVILVFQESDFYVCTHIATVLHSYMSVDS